MHTQGRIETSSNDGKDDDAPTVGNHFPVSCGTLYYLGIISLYLF